MQNPQGINLNHDDYFENYYFVLKSATKDTTIRRSNKKTAKQAFLYYLSKGKKLEWLGKWTGSSFKDTETPVI